MKSQFNVFVPVVIAISLFAAGILANVAAQAVSEGVDTKESATKDTQQRVVDTPMVFKRGHGTTLREHRVADEGRGLLGPHSAVRGANLKDCLLELDEPHGIVVVRYGPPGSQTEVTIFADNTLSVVRAGNTLFAETEGAPK